jgi:hypothetical protein
LAVTENSVVTLLQEIDAVRAQLRATLDRMPEAAVARRPPSGEWSILENVRHLLFAEQLHLGRFLRERPVWSPLGFTPETMRTMRKLPSVSPTPRLVEVWAAWDEIHAATVTELALLSGGEVSERLVRHLKHLRMHTKVIDKLAQQASVRSNA